jgi:hypothetical protein
MSHEATIQLSNYVWAKAVVKKGQRARITHNVSGVSRMSTATYGCSRSSGPPAIDARVRAPRAAAIN